MRPLIVVNLDERIEAFLLLQIVEGCWLGGLVLQGEMHAFMAPVLLRVARLDPLDPDPELQPPNGQRAQAEEGVGRSEGHTVVGADRLRQPKLPENPLER